MKKRLIGCAVSLVCGAACADLADYVDPFVGTSATGHAFPGACVPFGMVQASPDGGTESWHYCSGYRYEDREIKGFSQTHLNGTGGCELGDVRILPFVGEKPDFVEKIDKKTEMAKPGYYAVTLKDAAGRSIGAPDTCDTFRLICPCFVTGEAAGTAAALAALNGVAPRNLDVKTLQGTLREHGVFI